MASHVEQWSQALKEWALPSEIENSAEESPWIHPPVMFTVPEHIASTPSHDRAREALRAGDTVLDVGCGGGIAAFALTPPATSVIGVDHQPEMLAMFERNAAMRHLSVQTFEGFWPEVASDVPSGDVVTAHHVAYNVSDIEPFIRALDDHARARVVIEIPDHHPLSDMSEAWRHFWKLERPSKPTSRDLYEVLLELGLDAHLEQWTGELRRELDPDLAAEFLRIRLCLPASRLVEVREFLDQQPAHSGRALSTLWWDTASKK